MYLSQSVARLRVRTRTAWLRSYKAPRADSKLSKPRMKNEQDSKPKSSNSKSSLPKRKCRAAGCNVEFVPRIRTQRYHSNTCKNREAQTRWRKRLLLKESKKKALAA